MPDGAEAVAVLKPPTCADWYQTLTLDGHVTRMRGQLLDDPAEVAPLYAGAIDHFGVKRAQRMLGLKIHTPATPATEALAEAVQRYHLSAIRLTVKT